MQNHPSTTNTPIPDYSVVVPAAGLGTRMKAERRKPFLKLDGHPLVLHTVSRLSQARGCRHIVLAVHPDDLDTYNGWDELLNIAPRQITIVPGGTSRQESVLKALRETPSALHYVLIHDAARPLVRIETIEKVASTARQSKAAIAALPASETVKIVDENKRVEETPNRSRLWMTHTPQGFERQLILDAHQNAMENGLSGTDDASLVELLGKEVRVVKGDADNLKITTPEDLQIAEAILTWQDHTGLPEARLKIGSKNK